MSDAYAHWLEWQEQQCQHDLSQRQQAMNALAPPATFDALTVEDYALWDNWAVGLPARRAAAADAVEKAAAALQHVRQQQAQWARIQARRDQRAAQAAARREQRAWDEYWAQHVPIAGNRG